VAAGANPEILRGGIEKAVEVAVAAIKERAKEISGRGEISRVGAISARSEGG
jgi:chaperonin GroEL